MAVKDVRPVVSRYHGGRSGGRSERYYDDEGRGRSMGLWEWFKEYFEANPTLDHLLEIQDDQCYRLLKYSVTRHGLMDIAYMWLPGWRDYADTRAHRLVLQHKLSEAEWCTFHQHLLDGFNRTQAERERIEHARAENEAGDRARYEIQQVAKRLEIMRADEELVYKPVELTAGMLATELGQVFTSDEKVGDQGDWIEDAVDTYNSGQGFGYEVTKATGVKIQITLSLDLSNSMYYNGVHMVAAAAFRDLGLALKALKAQYPEDLYTAFFTFSEDAYGAGNSGKYVVRLETPEYDNESQQAQYVGKFEEFRDYRPSIVNKWNNYEGVFTGTDTWVTPLFLKIEDWEKTHSDPGALKLDIVITDAVVEHKKDIREADIIQERRDGSLQTVFLNFMAERDVVGSTLPKRCFNMCADKDNVSGLLRNLIMEFVGAHL